MPGYCCQAAGGDPRWADDIAAAWLMFYLAADLMDSVEDQDKPDSWWAELGPAAAINVATGLYFGASRSLNRIYQHEKVRFRADELIEDFNTSFLRMCGGQHRDITNSKPTLEQYWQIAESKSGTFFALACRSGARLIVDDMERLGYFSNFGKHLGVLIQILDDLEDLKNISEMLVSKKVGEIFRSLPVVYALEVSPPPMQKQLRESLHASYHDQQAAHEALGLIEQSGVVLYLMTEIERYKFIAFECLEKTSPRSPAAEELAKYIRRLGPTE